MVCAILKINFLLEPLVLCVNLSRLPYPVIQSNTRVCHKSSTDVINIHNWVTLQEKRCPFVICVGLIQSVESPQDRTKAF
jgi:hypothetical protein